MITTPSTHVQVYTRPPRRRSSNRPPHHRAGRSSPRRPAHHRGIHLRLGQGRRPHRLRQPARRLPCHQRGLLVMKFGDFAMQRRMLRGIKMRAKVPSSPAPPRRVGQEDTKTPAASIPTRPGVYLYWIPLGAGTELVRFSGRTFELLSALLQRRPRRDLYHSALVAVTTDAAFMIEMTPVIDSRGRQDRGVVAEGTVGTGRARRFRLFRYEIRRWRNGVIPDLGSAVASPVPVGDGDALARVVVDLVPFVPTPVWGRDELSAGEMWNSNSVTSWLLASTGLDADAGRPPKGGRAPGWSAGVAVAHRRSPIHPQETAA